jgi:biopolymer transport protein TolQ
VGGECQRIPQYLASTPLARYDSNNQLDNNLGRSRVNFDSSLFAYFLNAGLVVKCVLLILISASILSWTYIFQRATYMRQMSRSAHQFEESFWEEKNLSKIYADSLKSKSDLQGLQSIFHAGFREFLRLNKPGVTVPSMLESVKRAMRVVQSQEQDNLEAALPVLATIGSTSPYVGLFGTVWGIMTSFQSLAHVQQATIAMVAPGIAEALIATAMGLFAAIPAAIAYNRYSTEAGRLLNRFDAFQESFMNILFHHAQQQPGEGEEGHS